MAATVVLSMEVELAWGRHDLPGEAYETLDAGRAAETETLDRLLAATDRLGLPVSFGVVGHLFHDHCAGTHDSPHEPGWFDADPGTDSETDPLFYAPDLIDAIEAASTDHEIATHTYSHALCDEVDRETLRWELERVREVHASFDLPPPRSFVAPRHRPVDHSVLADAGIAALRRPVPGDEPHESDGLRAFLEQYVRSHELEDARVVDDVLETYCSYRPSLTAPFLPNGQRSPPREHAVIPRRIRERVHRRFLEDQLEAAAADGSDLHLWTHLYNLSNDAQYRPVESFLQTLAEQRNAGAVDVVTMAELAAARGP